MNAKFNRKRSKGFGEWSMKLCPVWVPLDAGKDHSLVRESTLRRYARSRCATSRRMAFLRSW